MEQGPCAGTILVVDDEPLVSQLIADILNRFGYGVLTADCGADAVNLYQKQHQEIDAVVLDVVMPVMDGKETLRRLRAINPQVVVIISSGHSHDNDADDLLKQGAVAFVQKPYRIADLMQAVKDAVERKKRGNE